MILNSLKSRIFFLVVALIITVLSLSLLIFYEAIVEIENKRFQNNLNNARNTVEIYLKERERQFSNSRESINRAIVNSNMFAEDADTIYSFLESLFARTQADLIMPITSDGKILAQVLRTSSSENDFVPGPETGQTFRHTLQINNKGVAGLRVYEIENKYYQFSLSQAKAGPIPVGWVAYGYLMDEQLTTTLHTDYANNHHVSFILVSQPNLDDCKLIASSKEIATSSCDASIADYQKAEHPITLGTVDTHEFQAVIFGSRSTLLSAVGERLELFYLLTGIVVLASVIGVYLIASIISKPVQILAEKARIISDGNYDAPPVELSDSGELGQLANEFNQMQKAVLEREQEIIHQSAHDPLTDLPNRTKLFEMLTRWHNDDERNHGLLLIKIDHIKDINESLGHETGDQVIKFVGERLRTVENVALLSHLRADEFVILVKLASESSVLRWVERVKSIMDYPFNTQGMTLHLSAHIGVARDEEARYQPGHFLRMADIALQMARRLKVPFKLYDKSLDQDQENRLAIMNELHSAIENNELILHYQPKLNTQSGQVDQVEALVRWMSPERGMVRPDIFIPIAENSGQMDALTTWVLEAAVKQHLKWKENGLDIKIAINISAENLKNDTFYSSVQFVMDQYNVDTSVIQLEVTESAVVDDPKSAIELLSRFKNNGYKLSIDDYGTGYSSLAQLKSLPVHELKIDMSFIKKLPEDEDDKIIVQSTIEMAHNMGMSVVAEGVETQAGLDWLQAYGCDVMQGYYISKPLAGDEFEAWYKESPYRS